MTKVGVKVGKVDLNDLKLVIYAWEPQEPQAVRAKELVGLKSKATVVQRIWRGPAAVIKDLEEGRLGVGGKKGSREVVR